MEQSKTYSCKKKTFFRLIPSVAFILFGLLSIVFFFLPAGELLGFSTGSLFEIIFAKALIPPSLGFICHVIVAVATLVYGIWATVYLAKGNKYKYLAIDIVGLVLILGQIVCAFITKSYVNGFLSDVGVGTILLLVFGFVLLAVGVVFTILHEVFAKKGLFDKGDKLFVRLPKVEPKKVSCPENVDDISLKRRLTFQNTLGHLLATIFATAGIWVMMFNFSVILRRNSNGFSDLPFALSIVFLAVSSAFAGIFFVVRLIMFFKNLSNGLKTPTEKSIKRSTRVYSIGVTTLLISLFAYVGDRALNAIQLIRTGRFNEKLLWQGDIGIYSQKMRLTFITIASIFVVACIVLSVINKVTAKKAKLRFLGTNSANSKTTASLSMDEFIEKVNLEKEGLKEYKKYLKELKGYVTYKKLLAKGVDEKGNYIGKTVEIEPVPVEKPETTAKSTRVGKIVIFDILSWFKFFAYATLWIFAIIKLKDLAITSGGGTSREIAFLFRNLSFVASIVAVVISAKLLGDKFNAIDRLPTINEAKHVRLSSVSMNVITTIFILWKVLALILGSPSDSALIMTYTEVIVLTAISFVLSISIIVSAKFVRKDMIKFTKNNTDLSCYELKELAINETDQLNKFKQYQKDVILFNQQKQ